MNPFRYGGVVTGEYFYDREEETKELLSTLTGGNNAVLYAPRRYGKTSLVFRLMELLETQGYSAIYLDFMRFYDAESFIENYTREILSKHKSNFRKIISGIQSFISGIVPSISFDRDGTPVFSINFVENFDKNLTLEQVLDLPEKFPAKSKKTVVIFDEFQEITKLNGEAFEKLLRSKIQHQQNTAYLFLGSITHVIEDMFSNAGRAFYHSARIMSLKKIPVKYSVEHLIDKFSKSGFDIKPDIAEKIIAKAENIPYYIQFLAAELWQFCLDEKTIDDADIDDVAMKVCDMRSDYYWEMFSRLTGYQKKTLIALCLSGKNVFSKKYSKTHGLGQPSSTQKAIEYMINTGLIYKTNDSYHFADPFFKFFLLRYAI